MSRDDMKFWVYQSNWKECVDAKAEEHDAVEGLINCGLSGSMFRIGCDHCSMISIWQIALWEEELHQID